MKTNVPRQDFQEALAAAAALASSRTPKPILNCVKMVVQDEQAELSSTDDEIGLRVRVPVLSMKRAGEVVVPAERLLSIIRELPDVEVLISTDERYCVIDGRGSSFRIFTANVADFPPVPGFGEEFDLVVDGRELRRMIAMTIYAAARETSRYAINGVLWEKRGNKLFLVATDGRRLARAGGTLIEARSGDFEVILPAKALNVFERVFVPPKDGEPWPIRVKVSPNQVSLQTDDRVLSTVLVEGHFPKYEEVIPKGTDKKARVSREELSSAVRRAGLLTTEDSRSVKLSFGAEKLEITSQSPEQGDARIEIPAEYEGDPLMIGFNPAFLGDALRTMPYEQVTIEMQEPFRPGVLYGEDKNDFLYVVMPVSL